MGLEYVHGIVKWGEKAIGIDFLVDSDATSTVLEKNV